MKKNSKLLIALALVLSTLFSLCSCSIDDILGKMPWSANDDTDPEILWQNATYTENCEFGKGAKTVTLKVEQYENSVTFTIHTDKETVGAALIEHSLIEGEEGAYGLYVKKVNGITADYDVDQSYWAFYLGDDYAMSGVDSTQIEEGVLYRLVYTK